MQGQGQTFRTMGTASVPSLNPTMYTDSQEGIPAEGDLIDFIWHYITENVSMHVWISKWTCIKGCINSGCKLAYKTIG